MCEEQTYGECKTSMNICRFCLSRIDLGVNSDGTSEFSNNYGQKQVYQEMMKETFCIQFQNQDTIKNNSELICKSCITRLRDAHSFKLMVLRSEEALSSYLKTLHNSKDAPSGLETINGEDEIKQNFIKTEPLHFEVCSFSEDIEGTFDDDDEILANIKLELTRQLKDKGAKTVTRHKQDKKRCRYDITDHKQKIEKENWLKLIERRGNGPILRDNSLKLLANSTICVFQWDKSRYRCFCCKEPFSEMDLLRKHTNKEHTLQNIEKKIIAQQNRLVKVEITKLYCKICDMRLESLNNLRKHLVEHDITFELNEDLLVPFKIETGTLQCQICMEKFNMFRLLNIHMNRHFQKQVCHICGAGFSNLVFLNLHKTRSHKPLSCKDCGLSFQTKIEKRDHEWNIHGVKLERKLRFPCPYCEARFYQENFRVQHLVEKHGLRRPEYKCMVCSKVFITKSLCNNHTKNVHMKEKSHQCDVCHRFFYTKSDVTRHRVTHTGEKKFSCTMCQNNFATKDSLRRHVKRTHGSVN